MPYILVSTNVSKDLITDEYIQSLGDSLAKTLDRPREKCIVHVVPGKMFENDAHSGLKMNKIILFFIYKMRKYRLEVVVKNVLA